MAINLGVASLESILESIVPVGTVIAFAGATVPTGWLLCDGSAVSRSSYARLFTATGIAHGHGDTSTTFNLPDYRGRFLRGVAAASTLDPDKLTRTAAATGGNTGNTVGSVQSHANESHTHGALFTLSSNAVGGTAAEGVARSNATSTIGGTSIPNFNQNTGGNESRPKNANVNYLIRI